MGYRTAARQKARIGYIHVHAAVDDHSRLAYVAVYPDNTAPSCADFLEEAIGFFAGYGISIEEVMTDNAKAYQGKLFTHTRTDWGIDHILTRPYRPQTNGKVERFFRTLKAEWSHVQPYQTEHERQEALEQWLHHYNHHRHHTATGGPPIHRVNNQPD
jgi:transposase InsO family protein